MLSLKDLKNNFAGKKVFITGHTGFKGSWLSFLLHKVGAEVMGFSLPPETSPNHFDLLTLNKKIKTLEGDIRDKETVSQAMINFQPEFVFHLAAQALVPESYKNPTSTIATNVIGSANVLDAVHNCHSVRSMVYITSDKCYENFEWIWGYRESDQLGGRDPYSASKAAAEIIFSSYNRSFFEQRTSLGAATTRAGNVIGGGDWAPNRIIPDCIRAIEGGQAIKLRNPEATRPWQHVLEPISGYLMLAIKLYKEPKLWQGAWNFGPFSNEVKTVQDVAETVIQHYGKGSIKLFDAEIKNHEAKLLQLNCEKAQHLLGWHPRWRTDQSLEATALWYKTVYQGGSPEAITWSQICSFFLEEV